MIRNIDSRKQMWFPFFYLTVQNNKLREEKEPVKQLRTIMSKDVSDVLEYAEKENKLVEKILSKEGGERDLLALGQQPGKFGGISIGDAQNKIKNLEEMINDLEQKKKELSLNFKKKKKKGKKKKELQSKPSAKPLAVNETISMQKDEKVNLWFSTLHVAMLFICGQSSP